MKDKEPIIIKYVCLISTCLDAGRVAYDIQQQIIDIINKAKGGYNVGF